MKASRESRMAEVFTVAAAVDFVAGRNTIRWSFLCSASRGLLREVQAEATRLY